MIPPLEEVEAIPMRIEGVIADYERVTRTKNISTSPAALARAEVLSLLAYIKQLEGDLDTFKRGVNENADMVDEQRERAEAAEAQVKQLEEERDEAFAALELVAKQQPKTLRMIKSNGFIFDSIGREPGNWQHLAFSIYNDLCEVDSFARAALAARTEEGA